jgi:hypothetical protein
MNSENAVTGRLDLFFAIASNEARQGPPTNDKSAALFLFAGGLVAVESESGFAAGAAER